MMRPTNTFFGHVAFGRLNNSARLKMLQKNSGVKEICTRFSMGNMLENRKSALENRFWYMKSGKFFRGPAAPEPPARRLRTSPPEKKRVKKVQVNKRSTPY